MNEREAYTEYRAGKITRQQWSAIMLLEYNGLVHQPRDAGFGKTRVVGYAIATFLGAAAFLVYLHWIVDAIRLGANS